MAVEFKDFSIKVKTELNDTTIAWLYETANEIASHAKRNCAMDGDIGSQLRDSYRANVNDGKGEAKIGTSLEAGYWEEWGTGEYAAHGDGRKGWWIYSDKVKGNGGKKRTERQAKAIAASDPTLHATNGRRPSYTLEKAFKANQSKAIANLERKLKEMG